MKLRDFGVFVDENIDSDVADWLRNTGFDVADVRGRGLQGSTDAALLRIAVAENRVILTHDSDFGTLAILQAEPLIGIVYLRPGHIDPRFTIETITSVLAADPEVTPPFILVARRTGDQVAIRLRTPSI